MPNGWVFGGTDRRAGQKHYNRRKNCVGYNKSPYREMLNCRVFGVVSFKPAQKQLSADQALR